MSEIVRIAIIVFCGALILPVLSKVLSKNDRLLRGISVLILILYILGILYVTLLTRMTTHQVKYQLSLFWSYRASLAFGEDGGLVVTNSRLFRQIILNILLYIPLGYLLPVVWPRLAAPRRFPSRPRVISMIKTFPWIVVLIGVILSAATELTQLFFKLGLFELDDILNNTIGCLIGVVLYQVLLRPRAKKTA